MKVSKDIENKVVEKHFLKSGEVQSRHSNGSTRTLLKEVSESATFSFKILYLCCRSNRLQGKGS